MEKRDDVKIAHGSVFHTVELENADDLSMRAGLTRQIACIVAA